MKSFTGIIFWSILLICSACTDENETNNGKRTDCYNGTPLTVRATATGFENVPGSEKPSTRASVTDEHLKTEFVDGDSIGIFSIKDGTIVDDINNIPLVYNVSNDSWNPVENSKTLYWYDGASYIAYYPYRKNITLDVSKDTDEAIASLTRNEKLQPSKDQSTKEKHTVSDLLIATGVPTTGNSSGIILNLQFKHQFTLLVLQPQAYIGCFAPENAGFVYHKESRILGTDSAAINVNLIDADFVNKVKAGDIMVGGENFGCGSSREHAPIAIKASGIDCVIAKTFARIFYRNSINIGLPILECPEASEKIENGDEVTVDFDTGVITNETKGETYQALPFPDFIKDIMAKGGLMNSLKA